MIIITSDKIHIPNIIWEQSASCSKNCNGCYKKEYRNIRGKKNYRYDLYKGLFIEKNISCDWLITSLEHGRDISTVLMYAKDKEESGINFKICCTCHNIETFVYLTRNWGYGLVRFFEQIDMFCVSSIPNIETIKSLKEICKFTGTKLVYNYLASKGIGSKQWIENLAIFDEVRVIAHKPCLGDIAYSMFNINYKTIKQILIYNKINFSVDRCFEKGLSSTCCDTIVIWPNGELTQCPYDSKLVCCENRINNPMKKRIEDLVICSECNSCCNIRN